MRTQLAVSALVAIGAAMGTTAVPAAAAPSADGPVIIRVGEPPEGCPFEYTGVRETLPVVDGVEVCVILPPHQ